MADEPNQSVEDTELALDMVGRAYLALAIMFETAHPGEFGQMQARIRAFVEDNLRIVAETSRTTDQNDPAGVAARVHGILTDIEAQVAGMIRPSRRQVG